MVANNMAELEKMLLKEMKKAMQVSAQKSLADMYEETGDFYTGGDPDIYERTGALGDTPRTTEVSTSGNEVSYKAYLEKTGGYTTGDNPSMEQVLNLANYGDAWTTSSGKKARPVVGKSGFWERAERKIEKDLNDTMSSFFG